MPRAPLSDSSFTLDTSGLLGFFGGEEAVSAMTTVNLFVGKRCLGWYNSPGSYAVARHCGKLAKSKLWRALYPGTMSDPIDLLDIGGKKGPAYVAAHSDTVLEETGYLARLFINCCDNVASEVKGRLIPGEPMPWEVTVAKVEMHNSFLFDSLAIRSIPPVLLAWVSIAFSIGACILCAFYDEWFAFAMILLGIVANGITCYTVGSAQLTITHPWSTLGSPRGDGCLIDNRKILVLLGDAGSITTLIKGSFALEFLGRNTTNYDDIGFCSLLLTLQFLLQLVLVPQSGLFGQLMFVITIAVAWVHNSYLFFIREQLHTRNLASMLKLNNTLVQKYGFMDRKSMSVFIVLVLKPADPRKILDRLLPDNTTALEAFKNHVSSQVRNASEVSDFRFHFEEMQEMSDDDRRSMNGVCREANEAYEEYCLWRDSLAQLPKTEPQKLWSNV